MIPATTEPWLCPVCLSPNDGARGYFESVGYCQSAVCTERRGIQLSTFGQRAILMPEIWAVQVREVIHA